MDIQVGLVVGGWSVALIVASTATWAACRWWYGLKLLAAAHRLHKSEKGRLFSHEQTQQARRQIELLKAEMTLRQQVEESRSAEPDSREVDPLLCEARDPTGFDALPRALPPSHGFADTQVMP